MIKIVKYLQIILKQLHEFSSVEKTQRMLYCCIDRLLLSCHFLPLSPIPQGNRQTVCFIITFAMSLIYNLDGERMTEWINKLVN